jgi:hypothetical protein
MKFKDLDKLVLNDYTKNPKRVAGVEQRSFAKFNFYMKSTTVPPTPEMSVCRSEN